MNERELNIINDMSVDSFKFIKCFGTETKTLLFGFEKNLIMNHVYKRHGKIHILRYKTINDFTCYIDYFCDEKIPTNLIPNNVLWIPEYADFKFCESLKKVGVAINFDVMETKRFAESKKDKNHGVIFENISCLLVNLNRFHDNIKSRGGINE